MKIGKKNPQLKVRVGRTLEGTIFEVTFLVLAVLLWAYIVWLIGRAPSEVPTQYDLHGNANGWGSPLSAVFPLVMTTVIGACLLAGAYFPHTINLPVEVKTPRQVEHVVRLARIMALETLLLTLCLALVMLGPVAGTSLATVLIFASVAVMLITIVAYTVIIYRART